MLLTELSQYDECPVVLFADILLWIVKSLSYPPNTFFVLDKEAPQLEEHARVKELLMSGNPLLILVSIICSFVLFCCSIRCPCCCWCSCCCYCIVINDDNVLVFCVPNIGFVGCITLVYGSTTSKVITKQCSC